VLASGSATSDLTNAQCSPNTIHWTYDTYMVAKSTGQALVRAGNDSWFLLVADFAFGYALERDAGAVVVKEGGNVLGSVRRFTGREGNETTPTATENDRQVDTAAFNRAVFASLKPDGTYFIPTVARHAAAEEQQIAGRHRLNISAERRRRLWELEPNPHRLASALTIYRNALRHQRAAILR
jgi:hypothetical protein